MDSRTCKACGAAKSLDDFHSHIVGGKRYWKHTCKECVKPAACARKKRWYAADPARAKEDSRTWYENNKDRALENRAEYKARRSDWWREYHRQWRSENRAKITNWVQRYQAAKLRAMPAWADRVKIEMIYRIASETEQEVDHIVPLRSPVVCGLHVEHNLQLLPGCENNRKGNRWWPDMWEGE